MPAKNKNAKPASLNLDDYTFDVDGDTYSIPSFGAFNAGDIRAVRKLDEVDQMFTLVELVADKETLAAIDAMSIPRLTDFFSDWQDAAGVSAPN